MSESSPQKGQDRHAAAVLKAAGVTEMASSVLAYGLVLALAPLGARYLAHDPATAGLFAFSGLAVLANLMAESATGLLQILNQFRIIAAITVGQSVLTLGLIAAACYLAWQGEGALRAEEVGV
jgi:O-antigen/teichoic acid export membrane protein